MIDQLSVFIWYALFMHTVETKDFDALVQEVNAHLLAANDQKPDFKTKVKMTILSTLEWIQSMNVFWHMSDAPDYPLYLWLDTNDLQPHQIDAICLASDRVRAFEKTKQKFEQEKIGKDPETVQKIENEISNAKKTYEQLYNFYKKNFYRN